MSAAVHPLNRLPIPALLASCINYAPNNPFQMGRPTITVEEGRSRIVLYRPDLLILAGCWPFIILFLISG